LEITSAYKKNSVPLLDNYDFPEPSAYVPGEYIECELPGMEFPGSIRNIRALEVAIAFTKDRLLFFTKSQRYEISVNCRGAEIQTWGSFPTENFNAVTHLILFIKPDIVNIRGYLEGDIRLTFTIKTMIFDWYFFNIEDGMIYSFWNF
jgi:hypothetical protein